MRRYRSFFSFKIKLKKCVQMKTDVKATGADKSEKLEAKKETETETFDVKKFAN